MGHELFARPEAIILGAILVLGTIAFVGAGWGGKGAGAPHGDEDAPGPMKGAVSATLRGLYDAATARPIDRSLPADLSLAGVTIAVTGASRGLGHAIASALAARDASLVVLCRSRLEETVQEMRALGNGSVLGVPLDLERLSSVDAAVARLSEAGVRLDRLVLNAGMLPITSRLSADGIDVMLQVNWLSNVRLVQQLLHAGVLAKPRTAHRRRRSASPARGRSASPGASGSSPHSPHSPHLPRIVIVGSDAHRSSPRIEPASELAEGWSYGAGSVVAYYGRSKLYLHTWACELARRLDGLAEVQHLCPGAVSSQIGRECPWWCKPLLSLVMAVGFQTPSRAAVPAVWCAASPEAAGRNGRYMHLTRDRPPSRFASDAEAGAALWAAAEETIRRIVEEKAETSESE